jgi:uncharacterized protein (TIGR02246 family)
MRYKQPHSADAEADAARSINEAFTMFHRARPLAAMSLATLSLTACGQGHGAPHAGGAQTVHAPVIAIATPPSKQQVAALLDDWSEALRIGGPHDVAMLYAEDAVLLPTDSNEVRSNRVEIADYFEHFLAAHPRATVNEQHVDVLDSNTAVNSGVYTIDYISEGQPTFVVARFNILYEKLGGKWLIKSHHSSVMPEPGAVRPPPLSQVLASNAPPTATPEAVAPAAPAAEVTPVAPAPAHAPATAHH